MSPLPPGLDLLLFPLVVAALLGLGAAIHRAVLQWISRGSGDRPSEVQAPEALVLSFGLGSGCAALLILALGSAKLLYLPVFWLLLALGLWLFWRQRSHFQAGRLWAQLRPQGWHEILLFSFVAAVMAFQLLGCMLPATGQDELTYHLSAPRQYLLAHRIHPTPHLLHANFPLNAEMLYLFCLGLGGEMLCKMLQWSQWLILLITLLAWVRRLDRGAGYLAVMLYLSPLAGVYQRAPTEAGSDLLTGTFFTLSLYCLARMEKGDWRRWVLLAGLSGGFAWGTKYVGPAFVTPAVCVYLVGRLLSLRMGWRSVAYSLALLLITTLLLFAPWMVKNALFTGNPVYPLAARTFPSPEPYRGIAERLYHFENQWNFYQQEPQPSSLPAKIARALGNYRDERVHWSLHEGDFLILFYLIFGVTGLILPIAGVRLLAWAALTVNIIFVFLYGTHLNRYFSITYSLAAALVALQLVYLFRQTSIERLLVAAFGVVLLLNLVNFQQRWCRLVDWHGRPLLTRQAHRQYLRRQLAEPLTVELSDRIAELTPPGAYLLGQGLRYPFHYGRRLYCTGAFEEELLEQLARRLGGWEPVAEALREQGFTHLVISREGKSPPPPPEWLEHNARLLWSAGPFELWQLSGKPGAGG